MYLIYPFHKTQANIQLDSKLFSTYYGYYGYDFSNDELVKIYGIEAIKIMNILYSNNKNLQKNPLIGWKLVNKIWNFLNQYIDNQAINFIDIKHENLLQNMLQKDYKLEKNHKQINYFDYYFIWFVQCFAKNKLYSSLAAIMNIINYSKKNKIELSDLQQKQFIAMVYLFCPIMVEYYFLKK